jgi:hypothetical protein
VMLFAIPGHIFSKNILIASPYTAQFLKFLKFSTGRLENDFIDSKRLYLTL